MSVNIREIRGEICTIGKIGEHCCFCGLFISLDDLGFGKLNISKIKRTWGNDLIIITIISTTYFTARCRFH